MNPHQDPRQLLEDLETLGDLTPDEQLLIGKVFKEESGSRLASVWTKIMKMALRSNLWQLAHPSFNTANGKPIDAETVKSQMLITTGRIQEIELLLKLPDTYTDLYIESEGQHEAHNPPGEGQIR